jgi:4-amino-4-deoxy-L-arabinose transferase-like glycosyltransferase
MILVFLEFFSDIIIFSLLSEKILEIIISLGQVSGFSIEPFLLNLNQSLVGNHSSIENLLFQLILLGQLVFIFLLLLGVIGELMKLKEVLKNSTSASIGLNFVNKVWIMVSRFRLVFLITLLAFILKIVYTHSISMWDEGWYVAIASRMADGLSAPLLPLYYIGFDNPLKFFDKPPFSFILGAFFMNIFGRSTIAAKGVVIIGAAGISTLLYFLFSHQKENRSAAAITGLLVALSYFLTSYGRTAYIDPFVIFMGIAVFVFGVQAINEIFVNQNYRKGYILIIVTGLLNILNILTKAWQGILIAPSLGIYLVFRYLERHIAFSTLKEEWLAIIKSFSFSLNAKGKTNDTEEATNRSPFPYLIFLASLISSFLISFLYNQLIIAGIILSVVISFTSYSVFLRYWKEDMTNQNLADLFWVVITSLVSGLISSITVSIFYNRLEEPFLSFSEAIGSNDVFSGLFGGLLTGVSEEALSNDAIIIFVLQVLLALIGAIIAAFLALILFGIALDLSTGRKNYISFSYEIIDIIPLLILGGWMLFWFIGMLLMGSMFNRDSLSITLFGILITVILTALLALYPKLKNILISKFRWNARIRSKDELKHFSSHLLFLGFALSIVILSFFPFVAWVQYIDGNIANGLFPWDIRVPGEMAGDPPNPLTYTFLFFEYYIGWRYTHGNAYDLASSVASALNDYVLLILLPFVIIGLWAFFFSKHRNPSLGAALITWFIVIPFFFFPAKFQLNYYYIPLVLPYLAIAAKGMEFIYSSEKFRLTAIDNTEKLLAGGYFFLEISYFNVFIPGRVFIEQISATILNGGEISVVVSSTDTLLQHLFVSGIYILPFAFLCFKVLKTFPGIFAAGFAYKYFIDAYFRGGSGLFRLYDLIMHDLVDSLFSLDYSWITDIIEIGAPLVTFLGILLLLIALYWLKPKVKPQLLVLLTLILSGMLIHVSSLTHSNYIFDLRFQEMAIYINNHGGDYNYSTWVIPEAGAGFSLRYYLGYEVVGSGDYPFSSNSSSVVASYSRNRPNIRFWAIINNSEHWNVPAYAVDYPEAYRWFTTNTHLKCVDEIVGLTTWHKMHLFVNATWISEQGHDWTTLSGN